MGHFCDFQTPCTTILYSRLDFIKYPENNPLVNFLSNYLRISIFIAVIMNFTLLIKIIYRFIMIRRKWNSYPTPTSIRNWKVWKRARNVGNRHQAQINQGCKKSQTSMLSLNNLWLSNYSHLSVLTGPWLSPIAAWHKSRAMQIVTFLFIISVMTSEKCAQTEWWSREALFYQHVYSISELITLVQT